MSRTRTAPNPDLFSTELSATSSPKLLAKLPVTPQEETQMRAELWETAPKHVRGVVSGENCIYLEACWRPIATLSAAELVSCFSLQ